MGLDIHIVGTLNSIILQEFGNVTSPTSAYRKCEYTDSLRYSITIPTTNIFS